jgi:hypothetical protein
VVSVVAVAFLILGVGWVWTWSLGQAEKSFQDRRHREHAEALLASLIAENGLYERFMWTDAETLLHQTVVPEGDADLGERIEEAKRNTAFLKRLDEIRLKKALNTSLSHNSKCGTAMLGRVPPSNSQLATMSASSPTERSSTVSGSRLTPGWQPT